MTTGALGGAMNIVNRGGGVQRTVLITGVSRGLGKALALEMAKRGHTVIGCSRSQDKLNSLQSELSSALFSAQPDSNPSSSDRHLFMNVDVRSNSNVEELVRAVVEKKGVPDIIGISNSQAGLNQAPNSLKGPLPAELARRPTALISTAMAFTCNLDQSLADQLNKNQLLIMANEAFDWKP